MIATHSAVDLLLGDEHVGVVLREGAHAHQPMQRARRLEAVHLAELGELVGQIAIAIFSPFLKIWMWPGQFIGLMT